MSSSSDLPSYRSVPRYQVEMWRVLAAPIPRQKIGSGSVRHVSPSWLVANQRSLWPHDVPRWNAATSATYPPNGSSATSMCHGTYPGIFISTAVGELHATVSKGWARSGWAVRSSSDVSRALQPATPDLMYQTFAERSF